MLKLSSFNKEVVRIRRNKRRGLSLKINQINLEYDPLWNRTTCTSCFLNRNSGFCLSPKNNYFFCDYIKDILRISGNKSIFFTKEGC